MICLFTFIFQSSFGAIGFLYCAEVTCDAGFGVCISVMFGTNFLIALTTEPLFNTIPPQSVFWLYGLLAIIGAFVVLFFLKETKGLSDLDKKELYKPKHSTNFAVVNKQEDNNQIEVDIREDY